MERYMLCILCSIFYKYMLPIYKINKPVVFVLLK